MSGGPNKEVLTMANRVRFSYQGFSADVPGPDQGILNGIWVALTAVGTAALCAVTCVFVKNNW